jgi:hypothetical protein
MHRIVKRFQIAALLLSMLGCPKPKQRTVSIEGYEVILTPTGQGWRTSAALERITEQLKQVEQVAPKLYASTHGKVRIWITDDNCERSATGYNPSAEWLTQHGHDAALAEGIEIINVKHFLAWSVPGDQPMMVLHELVHFYQDHVTDEVDADIDNTFNKVVASGKYQSVRYHSLDGPLMKAYALSNSMEYLAEISEAYFGINDYFPFNREQLKAYDPDGYALLQRIWSPESSAVDGGVRAER